jgi:hypothetical protein
VVYKSGTAMVQESGCSMIKKRERMLRLRIAMAGFAGTLTFACLLFLAAPLAQQAPSPVNPDAPNFDFSVYYTGNVRGNLEPCG